MTTSDSDSDECYMELDVYLNTDKKQEDSLYMF